MHHTNSLRIALLCLAACAPAGCALTNTTTGPNDDDPFEAAERPVDTFVGEPLDDNIDIEPDTDNDPSTDG